MLTLGIDLASQPRTTAACTIAWQGATASVQALELGLDDAALVERSNGVTAIGIDAPFGWPAPFVEMVKRHQAGEPVAAPWSTARRDELRFRRTDLRVHELTGRWPLSVSSDLIAIVAMRCAGLLDGLAVTDRSGDGRVYEVYPALSLFQWALPFRGYKKPLHVEERTRLIERLIAACPGFDIPEPFKLKCQRTDHAIDAMVAALTAQAAFVGMTECPGKDVAARARTEGWIAIPSCDALARLCAHPNTVAWPEPPNPTAQV